MKGTYRHKIFSVSLSAIYMALILLANSCSVIPSGPPDEYDVLIYGGTPGGITAAVQVARMGKTALIVEPGRPLGGMTSRGLGWVDIGTEETIGGCANNG